MTGEFGRNHRRSHTAQGSICLSTVALAGKLFSASGKSMRNFLISGCSAVLIPAPHHQRHTSYVEALIFKSMSLKNSLFCCLGNWPINLGSVGVKVGKTVISVTETH